MTTEADRPRRSLRARVRRSDKQYFVAIGSDVFELEGVAIDVWRSANGSLSIADIANAIINEYDVDPDTALRDTLGFIDELVAHQLFELAPNA